MSDKTERISWTSREQSTQERIEDGRSSDVISTSMEIALRIIKQVKRREAEEIKERKR
jgi:hypothetical protein